jgi:hypothetical protein
MKRWLLVGLLPLVVPVLCGCGGQEDTKLERQVRVYIKAQQRYNEVLKNMPYDGELKTLNCRQIEGAGSIGEGAGSIACEIDFRGAPTRRWAVKHERNGKFHFRPCLRYDNLDRSEFDPVCFKEIPGIADVAAYTGPPHG